MEELDGLVGQVVEGGYAAKGRGPDGAVVLQAKFSFTKSQLLYQASMFLKHAYLFQKLHYIKLYLILLIA